MRRRTFALAGALALWAGLAAGAERVRDYGACLAALDRDPESAREAAAEWRRFGGGAPAGLCEALALSALGARATAAARLDALASEDLAALGVERALEARALAADLWLSERAPERALRSLAAALDLAPGAPDLLAARAQALGALGDWTGAEAALDAALAAAPGEPGLLVMRAAARREGGDAAGALADADAALRGRESAAAWLEKGKAESAMGRRDAARESLLRAVEMDREGPDGAAARVALQMLDG